METTRSRDGTTIAFDRSGDGPPVIVVGGAACDRAITCPLAEKLAKHFTVINYDHRPRPRPVWRSEPRLDCRYRSADGMPKGQHGVLEGQEHVVPPEILVPVLVEFFDG